MCGIVAYVGNEPAERIITTGRVARRLRHRGPDDAGLHASDGAVVAHQRLSIVDVTGGTQPLLSEDGRLALVCNGEIYNHEKLRSQLTREHHFRTRSDSEVIIHLYEEMGPECVDRLAGMFAFVLTDGERVLAARDPLGIKPLYMGRDPDGALWFASEIKGLLDVCGDVREFPAGSLYTEEDGLRRWFQPSWIEPPARPLAADGDALVHGLERAVSKRLMSDVPLGVFLSGGLDSSIIAALVRPQMHELHSFSVGLDNSVDLLAARAVADYLDTRHHELIYTVEDMLEVLETVIYHLESYDPALIRSAIPCYFVSKLAADHVKVALSGEGSDEAFAGYRYFGDLSDADALHRESVRILRCLHNMNLQRVDRMTMAHALEGRVPFLDTDFLDVAMAIDPETKLHRPDRTEKWLLRRAFAGLLPEAILWRTKEEFAQGCGSEWALREYCDRLVGDAEFERASELFPVDTPKTKEAFHYRRIFEQFFPGDVLRRTVGRWHGTAGLLASDQVNDG